MRFFGGTMFWIVRYGANFYFQNSNFPGFTEWGARETARLFATKAQAECVVDALMKAGLCRGYALSIEQQYPDFSDVPPDLFWRLFRCAERLSSASWQGQDLWHEIWRREGSLVAQAGQACLQGQVPVAGDALEIDTGLLLDLIECAQKIAECPLHPASEAVSGVQEFAKKTVQLSVPYGVASGGFYAES